MMTVLFNNNHEKYLMTVISTTVINVYRTMTVLKKTVIIGDIDFFS